MDKEVGRIPKNSFTEIVLKIDAFGGRPGLTIREFSKGDRYTGFTKSGTKIPPESFEEFKALINSISVDDIKAAAEGADAASASTSAKSKKVKESLGQEEMPEIAEEPTEDDY